MLHAHCSPRAEADVVRRILIVDDEPGMAKSVAIMLRRERYQVSEAGSVAAPSGSLARAPPPRDHRSHVEPRRLTSRLIRATAACPVVVMTASPPGAPEPCGSRRGLRENPSA